MDDLRFSSSLQIMMNLAYALKQGQDLMTSTQLSEGLNTNPTLVRRLLVPLVNAGLVESFKGKNGGVRLAKDPLQITLRAIYEASVDSELVCPRDGVNSQCPVGGSMRNIFSQVSSGMRDSVLGYLESKTLKQLISEISC